MPSGFEHDPHSERGNACPKNKFGFTDYSQLQALETTLVLRRTIELTRQGMSGAWDTAHIREIHRYLFQDVFPWAGDFRVVNISKGNSMFGPALHIAGAMVEALDKLKRERYLSGLNANDFIQRAAFYLGEINAIHPFREGNGRTQREFIRQLAFSAGYHISWGGFSQPEMVEASIASHARGDNAPLARILSAALRPQHVDPLK